MELVSKQHRPEILYENRNRFRVTLDLQPLLVLLFADMKHESTNFTVPIKVVDCRLNTFILSIKSIQSVIGGQTYV